MVVSGPIMENNGSGLYRFRQMDVCRGRSHLASRMPYIGYSGRREAYEGTVIGGNVGRVIVGVGGRNLVYTTIVTASPAYTRLPFTVPNTFA